MNRSLILVARWLCLLATTFLPLSQGHGQTTLPRSFDRLGAADGLPDDYVNRIAQDHLGFMWFGTKNGLGRYDGLSIITFKHLPGDTTSLAGNDVLALFVDSAGRLWIGADGLHLYDVDQNHFIRIQPPRFPALSGKLRYISAIAEDRTGSIWIGTFGSGLFRFDADAAELTEIVLPGKPGSTFGGPSILALAADGDTLWATTDSRTLVRLDQNSLRPAAFPLPLQNEYNTLHLDRTGTFWLGSMGEPLRRLAGWKNSLPEFRAESPALGPADVVTCITDDRDGTLWLGSQNQGLFALDSTRTRQLIYRYDSRNPATLPGDEIHDLLEDRAGNLWIATNSGVGVWKRWKKPFVNLQHQTNQPNSLPASEVTGLDVDASGDVWIATLNTGISRYTPSTGRFKHYTPANSSLKMPWTREIRRARDGSVWVATNIKRGLVRFDPDNGTLRVFAHDASNPASLSANVVNTLYLDRLDRVWAGTQFHGLNLFASQTESFVRFQHDTADSTTISDNNILSLYRDTAGTVWIGTGNGLNRLEVEHHRAQRFFPNPAGNVQATGPFEVHAIKEDRSGRLWLGSNQGLFLFDRNSGAMSRRYVTEGVADNRIFGILEDGNGALWLQGKATLTRFDPESAMARVYDRRDGWIQTGIHEQEWLHAHVRSTRGYC